jgi:selenocysteine lyase/cysteine desulfurase
MNDSVAPPLDLAFVRSQFPSLAGACVYLDNAGGSQVLKRVADRISDYLLTTNVQQGDPWARGRPLSLAGG